MYRPRERARTPFGDVARPPTVALLGILVGLVYLWWRTTTLGSGSLLLLSVPFFAVEAWSLLELTLLTVQTWRLGPTAPRADFGRQQEPVDIAIVAAGVDADELERTLMACRTVRSRGRLVVIDDERRFRHRSLAADAGASYRIDRRAVASPGLAAYRNTEAPVYLWLRAGQLPTPDLVEVVGPRFDREDVAVCQLATSLLNSDDLAHLGRERDDDGLVNDVIGPGLSRWDAGLWLGSASVVRRRAIADIGGYDRTVPIERLNARLHRSGWATSFERRRLVATSAPEAIDHYVANRRQRAGAAWSVLGSSDGPLMPGGSMGWRRRLVHLAAALRFGTGVRFAVLAGVVVTVLLVGRFPADASLPALVAFGGTSAIAGALGRRAVARGSMQRGDWVHQGWRVIGAETAAVLDAVTGRVRPTPEERTKSGAAGGLASLAHLPLLDLVVLALDLALLARAVTIVDQGFLTAFSTGQRVLAIGFAVGMLVPIVRVLQVAISREQRRSHYRIPVALEATVDGTPVRTVDLTPDGAGILLPFEPSIGSTTSLEITLPGSDGLVRRIVGRAVIRSARPDGERQWRAGLQLVQMAPAARQALLAFCTQQPVPDDVDEDEMVTVVDRAAAAEQRRRRSVRRVTLGAGLAGLATVVFGPGVASASTIEPNLVAQVCVVGATGSPVGDIPVERLVGESSQVLGATGLTGCVDTTPDPTATGFAVTHRGLRQEVRPGDYRGTRIEVALTPWDVSVVDLDGEPVEAAEVRFFTDRWLPATRLGEPGAGHRFEGLPVDPASQQIEIRLDGVRFVRAMGDRTSATVILPRVRLTAEAGDPGQTPVIDRGRGWEPVADGMTIVPGMLVVRSADGAILRVDVPESTELQLPEGLLVPVRLDLADDAEPVSTSTSLPTSTSLQTSTSTSTSTATSTSAGTGSTSVTEVPTADAEPTPTTAAPSSSVTETTASIDGAPEGSTDSPTPAPTSTPPAPTSSTTPATTVGSSTTGTSSTVAPDPTAGALTDGSGP